MMITPCRLQLSRRKGFCLQGLSRAINGLECIKVARPTIWGNPIKVNRRCAAKRAAQLYRRLIKTYSQADIARAMKFEDGTASPMAALGMIVWRQTIRRRLPELRGKNLACWCALDRPCHADVLLEIANR